MANYAKVALIFAQTDPALGYKGLGLLPGRHRPARLQTAADRAQDGPARLRHRARSRSKTWRCPTTPCSARSATASRSRCPRSTPGRYSVAAGCVGICQGCVEESVKYAQEREQFGRPIASFQLVQAMIADMVLKTDASRMLVWRAGWLKDKGRPNTTRDLDREAARDRGGGGVREHRDPGPRRRRLRRRPPGRALLPRRARDDPVRGDLADPEADHRARDDRASTRSCPPDRRTPDHDRAIERGRGQHRGRRRAGPESSACSAPARWAPASPSWPAARAPQTLLYDPIPEALERGVERVQDGLAPGSRPRAAERRGRAGGRRAAAGGGRPGRARALRAGDRGGARAAGAQARALRAAVGDRQRELRAGDQHLLAARHRDRRGRRPPRAGGGDALLQPGAGDGACWRSIAGEQSRRAGAGARARDGRGDGQDGDRRHRRPGLPRQPLQPAVRPGGAAAAGRSGSPTIETIDRICRHGGRLSHGARSS